MRKIFNDLETRSPVPIKHGSHRYAEEAEIMLWAWAVEDGQVFVWDVLNDTLWWEDEISGLWRSLPLPEGLLPEELAAAVRDPEALIFFHNGTMFDFVVLEHNMPAVAEMIAPHRRLDTMEQAYTCALPGALDKLGVIMNLSEEQKKLKDIGRKMIELFCKPNKDGSWNTIHTHPHEWMEFIRYAGRDITTMRAAHNRMPKWGYEGKQLRMAQVSAKINYRGFRVDIALAEAAIRVTTNTKAALAKRTQEITDGEVQAATQRDRMLKYLLESHGVELPDFTADTIERRLNDENLPEEVRELLRIRLSASMNSVSKYKTILAGVSKDGRMRGCAQFRGAGRTGRYAHRLFQPGNLPRPKIAQSLIAAGIVMAKLGDEDIYLVTDQVMEWASSALRGLIIPEPGNVLCVSDLANIEGRGAAWLAGEEWKLAAFRLFDSGEGVDLYILAYAKSFNVDPESVPKKGPERQIGKVEELMFQYQGGVGAWITGAATYGIDLDTMTEQVYPVLPEWAVKEAEDFLAWLYSQEELKAEKAMLKAGDDEAEIARIKAKFTDQCTKIRFGLEPRTFAACDAIKRLWRKAHPAISSYWKELEETVLYALANPGETLQCRKVKIRRAGAWLRIQLPSGRPLCYPNPGVDAKGIFYTGMDIYTRKWGKVYTYGGKIFENIVQAVAADQLIEPFEAIEDAGYQIVMHVHDEIITEIPKDSGLDETRLGELMCMDLGWNEGLPLAAAGFVADRYKKD